MSSSSEKRVCQNFWRSIVVLASLLVATHRHHKPKFVIVSALWEFINLVSPYLTRLAISCTLVSIHDKLKNNGCHGCHSTTALQEILCDGRPLT